MKQLLCFVLAFFCFSLPVGAQDAPCAEKDAERYVAGGKECLAYRAYGLETAGSSPTLVVFLHGDGSTVGSVGQMYGYASWIAKPGIVGVALLRPGYYDAGNYRSTGDDNGRRDNYTAHNVDAIALAIGRLKDRLGAKKVFLVGHSGGAAVAGVILGRHPTLASGALLVSCPCDLEQWYWSRRFSGVARSISPHSLAEKVPPTARIILLSGTADDVVYPEISQRYAATLAKKGVKAEYKEIPGGDHRFDQLARSPVFSEAVVLLLGDVILSQAGGTGSGK